MVGGWLPLGSEAVRIALLMASATILFLSPTYWQAIRGLDRLSLPGLQVGKQRLKTVEKALF
jgi:hypothetical protein